MAPHNNLLACEVVVRGTQVEPGVGPKEVDSSVEEVEGRKRPTGAGGKRGEVCDTVEQVQNSCGVKDWQMVQAQATAVMNVQVLFFGVQTWVSWQSPLSKRYSSALSKSGSRAVQCYDCPTAHQGWI